MEDFEREFKVVVVGNGGVGKTSLIRCFCNGGSAAAIDGPHQRTIGVDFLERSLYVPAVGDARLLIWDTAGQEEFDALTRSYFRGAHAAVLAFSTTDRASFEALPRWRARLAAECGDGVAVALVQTKVDLLQSATVSPAEAEEMARRLGVRFYRACAREGLNVDEVFLHLAELAAALQAAAGGGGKQGTAAQPLAPVSAAAAAAAAAAGSGSGAVSTAPAEGAAAAAAALAAAPMLVTVELVPPRGGDKKGRKTVAQRVGKAASKAAACVS